MKRNCFFRMTCLIGVLVILCTCIFGCACAEESGFSVDPSRYELEQMLIFSRHNIRSPLSTADSLLGRVTNHKWHDWSAAASELTLRGGELETLMGQYFRKYLVSMGLMEDNWIPEGESVRVYANSMQRTIATANYFSTGMFPIGNVDVEYHEEVGTMDPVFFPGLTFSSEKYAEAAREQAAAIYDPSELQDNIDLLETVLDYSESPYAQEFPHLNAADMEAHYVVNDGPRMTGTLSTASSAADALKLQYYEENDDLKAAFGHALSLKDWADICEITETYGAILFSTPLVAVNTAHPLLQEMYAELTNGERVFTFLCGHDSNIIGVLTALDAKPYSLPNTLEKRTPIGSKIVFEKWRSLDDGRDYISLKMVYQSLEQRRQRQELDLNNPPMSCALELNGLEANADGLYPYEDVLNRFEASIAEYDRMVETYK